MKFMQATTRANLSSTWNFNEQDVSIDAMRDALIDAL
jgi:hypothetical protein